MNDIIYTSSLLSEKLLVSMSDVGKNIKQLLEREIKKTNEGRCIAQGYVRPNSIKIVSYSCGLLKHEHVEFAVAYECEICHPVEGLLVECVIKSITKMGIHAFVADKETDTQPIVVFIARDHQYTSHYFNSLKEGEVIIATVIGVRYELNDRCVYVIATAKPPPRVQAGGSETDSERQYAATAAEDSESDEDKEDEEEG